MRIIKICKELIYLFVIISIIGCDVILYKKPGPERRIEFIPKSDLEIVLEKGKVHSQKNYNRFDTNKKTRLGWYYEFRNGKMMIKAQIKEKVFHGKFWSYYSDDQLKTDGYYIEGKKSGYWQQFFSNGKIINHGNWDDDIEIGEWIFYDSLTLEREVREYNGIKGNYISHYWNGNGNLISETTFEGYKKNGIQKTFDDIGHLINRTSYLNNIPNGEAHEWVYGGDSLKTHATYHFNKNGKREGWAKFYDSNKKVMFELLMKGDSVIREVNY